WYRVDLLFFHRRLRCLVLIDLKLGRFSTDAGQMNLYLNYAREHWTCSDENPPIGLILCSARNEAVAHYALGNLQNWVLAREYRLTLPEESVLVVEISHTRRALSFVPERICHRAAGDRRRSPRQPRDRNSKRTATAIRRRFEKYFEQHQRDGGVG